MSHDFHFLERTIDESRISVPAMERAMLLYRDPELVRLIFEKARLPEGIDDIAIALTNAEQPPHLLVHRSGHFRTILGPGMPYTDARLLSHERFEGLVDQMAELKERLVIAERLAGEHGSVGNLLMLLREAGSFLSREQFIAVSHWQPLLRDVFASLLADTALSMDTMRLRLRRLLQKQGPRQHRLQQREGAALRFYWQAHHLAQHLALLTAMDSHRHATPLPVPEAQRLFFFTSTLIRLGTVGTALRFGWIAGELGKTILSAVKRLYTTTSEHWDLLVSTMGLLGIAGRRPRTCAEIVKILDAPLRNVPEPQRAGVNQLIAYIRNILAVLDRSPADLRRDWQSIADSELARQENPIYRALVLMPEFAQELPPEYYLAAAAQSDGSMSVPAEIIFLMISIPVLAIAEPKDFYFPENVNSLLRRDWQPRDTIRLLEAQETILARPTPVRAAPKLGPNDPCQCGSGKKYKRCCRD